MAVHYYVYYRIDPGKVDEAAAAIRRAQEALGQRTGVSGRRLRRTDDPTTWMEVYENIVERNAFETCLAAIVSQHDLVRWLAPEARRHLECFED